MGGAVHRRRAGGVGGEVVFFIFFIFLILQIFFTDQNFTQTFFLFDFDANFFILSIFFRMQIFFYSGCQISLYKISQFLSLKFLFLTFSRQKILSPKFLLEKISKIGKRQKNY